MLNKKIPLFDLDWTLIAGDSWLHKQSMIWAIHKLFREHREIDFDIQGNIDSQILYQLAFNITNNEELSKKNITKLINLTNYYFYKHSHNLKYISMPGSEQLLTSLKDMGIKVGVLTGNTKFIGEYKLRSTNLYKYIDYAVYGEKLVQRFELISDIYDKIVKDNIGANLEDLVIIGDTPKDIECAKKSHIQCIAIATGKFNKDQLSKADLTVETLEDREKIIQFIV